MKQFSKGISDQYVLIPSGKILFVCDVDGDIPGNIFGDAPVAVNNN